MKETFVGNCRTKLYLIIIISNNRLYDLDMELARRHGLHLGGDCAGDSQVGEAAPDEPARVRDELGRLLQVLAAVRDVHEESERVVLQHVDAFVIRAQIVDLLLVDRCPEVGADELHRLQVVPEAEPGPFPSEPLRESIARRVANVFEGGEIRVVVAVASGSPSAFRGLFIQRILHDFVVQNIKNTLNHISLRKLFSFSA